MAMPGRRAVIAPLLIAGHLAIIAAMLLRPAVAAQPPAVAALTVTAIPAPGVPVEALPPPVETDILAPVDPPDFDIASADVAVASRPCALAMDIAASLGRDRSVGRAVAQIPPGVRSVSNALLLWDGAWITAASIGGESVLGPIRAIVEAQVLAAPAACRNETVTGPRLLVVPDGDRQIVLAFGSGQWRWETLL